MSAGTLIDVADAVVNQINLRYSSELGVIAERTLDTEIKLEDLETLHISIVPGSVRSEIGTRETQRNECTVDIALRKRFDTYSKTEVDALFLAERNIDGYLFDQQRLLYMPQAAWLQSNLRYPYVPAQFRGEFQFTGILSVTYLVFD